MLFFTNRLTMIGWCVIAVLLSWDKVNPRMNLGRWQAESCGVTCYNSSKTILNSIILMILYYAFSLWPHSLYGIVFLIHLSHHRTAKRKKMLPSSHIWFRLPFTCQYNSAAPHMMSVNQKLQWFQCRNRVC